MKTNNSAVLQKAIERRNRAAYRNKPSEIMAVPHGVPVPSTEFFEGGQADMDAEVDRDPSEPNLMGAKPRSRKIIRGIL